MGDQTIGTLRLTGLLSASRADEIGRLLDHEFAEAEAMASYASATDALKDGVCHFTLRDVNYAVLDTDLKHALQEAGLAYAWLWESGDEYPEGLEIYDPFRKQERNFNTADGEILITLPVARDPVQLSETETWDVFKRISGFHVVTSNHHLLKLKSEASIDPRFFDNFR